MSRNAEMPTSTQSPTPEATSSARMTVAVIGPNAAHRKVVSKALAGSDARTVREFIDYPAKLTDVQRLMEQQRFDVVMIDVDSDQSYALQVVQKFAAIGNVMVMVYSQRNDQALLRSCLEAGASDFLPLPDDALAETESAPLSAPEAMHPVASPAVETLRSIPAPEEVLKPLPAAAVDILRSQPVPVASVPAAVAPIDILKTPSAPAETGRPYQVPGSDTARAASAPEMVYRAPATPEPDPSPWAAASQAVPGLLSGPAVSQMPDAAPRPAETGNALTDFTAWDNAWIRATQPSEASATEAKAKPAPVAPAAKANKAGRPMDGPKAAPAATTTLLGNAPNAPLFRAADTYEEEEAKKPDLKKWAIIGAVPAAIGSVLMVVLLRPAHHEPPAADPAAQSIAALESDLKKDASKHSSSPVSIPKPSPAALETPAADPEPASPAPVGSDMMKAQLSAPARISAAMKKSDPGEEQAPSGFSPVAMDTGGAVPGAVFGHSDGVKVVPGVSAISAGVAEGMLLHKSDPIYPAFARQAHLAGTVVLGATISGSGNIQGLHVISGPEIFRAPAMDAVKTWRYRPYKLNGQPVDVQTTIRVIFAQQH